MPDPKEDESVEFKVVDRRPFTADGQRRTDVEVEPPKAEPPRPKPTAESAKAESPKKTARPAEPQPEQQEEAQGAVQFEHLLMSLITSAMYQLGLAARPGEPPPPPDLAAAQETIQLLEVLQKKTKGNLTREEEEVLSGGLYELRLAFVELSRRAGQRP